MNIASINNGLDHKKTRVVEIIGPAGAGKTTFCNLLNLHRNNVHLLNFPNIRKLSDTPFFIYYGLKLVPTLFNLNRSTSRQFNRQEFVWMAILSGWPFVIQRKLKLKSQLIVLDQGPVYLMSELREFGPEYLRSKNAEKLWQKITYQWAITLDMVVWLDTSDDCLLERIRTRDKEHVLKNQSVAKAYEFLSRYRRAFDFIISSLLNISNNLKVLRFDTSLQQSSEIADHLFSELGLI